MIDRRQLLALGGVALPALGWAQSAASAAGRVLVLVELKGGNDGLNTVVPYAHPTYAQLRPSLALKADEVLRLDGALGLHPSLAPLMPMWEKRELAVLLGLGYPQPNLSHFRSIEIWDTASRATEYLDEGWVARAMSAGLRQSQRHTTEGVAIGSASLGALSGANAISLTNAEAFVNQARLLRPANAQGNAALEHVLRVESGVLQAADGLRGQTVMMSTEFPAHTFGQAVRATCQIVAGQKGRGGVPVFHLTHGSFDTHRGQLGTHANLLKQLAEGLAALKAGLEEAGAWERTLVVTYSEFGRRARQNQSGGTDHGTAAPHFVLGGAVKGGTVIGTMPDLDRLDGSQNLIHTADFRQLYATIARRWWGVNPEPVVRGTFDLLPFLEV